jgi:hypothetical protein
MIYTYCKTLGPKLKSKQKAVNFYTMGNNHEKVPIIIYDVIFSLL